MILHGLILLLSLVAFFFSSHTHFWGVLERAYPSFPQWSILVDTTTNAYHVWRWDPLLVLLTGESTLSTSLILPLLHLALFSLGTAGVFRFVFGSDWIRSFIDAVLSATMLVLLFGLHPVILGTLTWIPWCILCCRPSWLLSSSTSVRSGVALFLVLRLVRTAHQLSPLALAFVFITLFALKREKPIFLSRKGFTGIFFLIALALSLYHTFEVPTPPIPDYPPFAQVVPDDGVPGIVSPRLTSYAPFQIIDRSVLRYTLAPFALLGLLLSAFFLITSQKVSARNIASTSLVLFVLLTLDTYTAESLSIISPLQAARRLLPGAFFLSLTPAFLAFSLWFLWGTLLRHRTIPTVLFFLTLWAINPFHHRSFAFHPGKLLTPPLALSLDDPERDRAASPSYPLYRQFGVDTLVSARTTSLHLENLSTFSPTLRASMNNTESSLNRMLDGRGKTRWSEKTGNQNGSEWIEISLPSETTALALDLNVGKFSSDFPRGVRVTSWPRVCDKRGEDKGEIVYEQAQWLGSVNFTPQGFPYYKPQNQVIIRFQSAVTTQCLLVEQTSSAPFDWSVTRLRIARLPTKST